MKKLIAIALSFVAALGSSAQAHINTQTAMISIGKADELVRSGLIPMGNVVFVSDQELSTIISEHKVLNTMQTASLGAALVCGLVACILLPTLGMGGPSRARVPVVPVHPRKDKK